jgi:hypothetical protein
MSQLQEPVSTTTNSAARSDRWAGWAVFGAIMLTIAGSVNVMQGLVALLDEGYFLVPSGDDLLLVDYSVWGVVSLLWGSLAIAAGLGIFASKGWARWSAVAIAGVSILLQIGFLSAYPIWSGLIIAFDVLVILALTAHWSDVRRGLS